MSCEAHPVTGGFSFTNVSRNAFLEKQGYVAPKAVKTGTTIVGIVVENGVILGADTRATSGDIVADKNSEKIHRLAKRIYCCGAGTAADTEMTTRSIESQLELLRLNTDREVRVAAANRLLKQFLFRYQGHISAALIVGGVDVEGSHIYCIYPHGSTDKLPYTTMGSGSLAAMAVIENEWRPNMSTPDGTKLVRDAIHAGIKNDLMSGNSIDIYIIAKDQPDVQKFRPYEEVGVRGQREGEFNVPRGTTAVLKREIIPIAVESEEVIRMDTDE